MNIVDACKNVPSVTLEELENLAFQRSKSKDSDDKSWSELTKNSKPTEGELNQLYKALYNSKTKSAILSIIPEYCDLFPQSADHLPLVLSSLCKPENCHLNYEQLLGLVQDICKDPASMSQIKHVEELTRGQVNNQHWFEYRTGRITSSNFYQVCTASFIYNYYADIRNNIWLV